MTYEERKSGFALDRCDVPAYRGGGDAELCPRGGQILVPRGDFEHDERIHGWQGTP